MADINDRLERLSRRDELARRVRQRAVPASIAGVGDDFMDVVEAVAQIVRRRPGMSVLLAPGDGRSGSSVIRVTERHGEVEVVPVAAVGEFGPPPEPVGPWRPPTLEPPPPPPPPVPEPMQYDTTAPDRWHWER